MIKRVLLAAAAGTLASTLALAQPIPGPSRALTPPAGLVSPTASDVAPAPLDALAASSLVGRQAVWSGDGRAILYSDNRSGQPNLWRQALAGGPPEQITNSAGPKNAFRLSPDGRSVVWQGDVGGREINDLFLASLDGAEPPVNLTATPDVNETSPVFSADGRSLAFAARQADKTSDNLVLMDLASRARRQLTDEPVSGVHWVPAAFSRDGAVLVANRYDFSLSFAEAFLVNPSTGAKTQLTLSGRYGFASDITADGRFVAVTLENDAGLHKAALVEVATGKKIVLDQGPWEQRTSTFSPDGSRLLVVTNEDGREVVSIYDVATRKSQRLPLPSGLNAQAGYLLTAPCFSPDGRKVLFPHSAGSTPLDFWTYDLSSRTAVRRTQLTSLSRTTLPRTQIVHYASPDGTVVSAVVWMPFNLKRDGRAPAVVYAHGGPTGQQMDGFDRSAAALASRGFVVLSPNFRGSTGYGQAFLNANRLDLGGGDLDDLVAGAAFLKASGYVDARRIGVMGGSYGGYMTLMALGKRPEVFAAGVDMFGIVNWRTMWERGAPQNRRYQETLVGDPATHAAVYDRASPLTYLDQVRAPLLVLQGENDPRVPVGESRQVIEVLRARGQAVESHFYPEEGHGFAKPENQKDSLRRIVDWFEARLKAPGPASASNAEGRP